MAALQSASCSAGKEPQVAESRGWGKGSIVFRSVCFYIHSGQRLDDKDVQSCFCLLSLAV